VEGRSRPHDERPAVFGVEQGRERRLGVCRGRQSQSIEPSSATSAAVSPSPIAA
jgi:hypothetical protein